MHAYMARSAKSTDLKASNRARISSASSLLMLDIVQSCVEGNARDVASQMVSTAQLPEGENLQMNLWIDRQTRLLPAELETEEKYANTYPKARLCSCLWIKA